MTDVTAIFHPVGMRIAGASALMFVERTRTSPDDAHERREGLSVTVVEHPNATIPDSVEVPRVGALRYELGFPTPETSQKLFDEMDFQRAVQAYLWGYPAVSFESIRLTAKQDLDMDYNDLGIADNFVDPKSGWLTANDTTIYAFVNIDSDRRAGRDRDPTRSHRGPAGRLLAALADRCRPAWARRGQGWHVPAGATWLRRRGSCVRLLRASGNDAQPQPPGPRHHRRQRRSRRRSSAFGTSRSTRGASAKTPSRTSSSRSRAR